MSVKTIYFVRHGESEGNISEYKAGLDPDLTARGEEQALAVAERFVGIQVEVVIASPLVRARKTGERIANMIEKADDPKFFRQIIAQANKGEDIGPDIRIKLDNGNVLAIKTYPQLLEGKNVGRIWSFRDVTKYIKFQEEIQEKVTTLEQLNRTMVDRELKMIELKERLASLEQKS